jgi:hypothetical protein
LGVFIEGTYCPEHSISQDGHNHDHDEHSHHHGMSSANASACGPQCCHEVFTRLLNVALPVVKRNERRSIEKKMKKKK